MRIITGKVKGMGYTHYFTRDERNVGSRFMFTQLSEDAKRIIQQAQTEGIEVCGWNGKGKPEFTEDYFSLNGTEVGGYDHETFRWEATPTQPEWHKEYFGGENERHDIPEFCKTAYKPYDAVVTAILIRAKVIYGQLIRIGSDGSWDEWETGRDLYELTFGEEAPNPFAEVAV